jgi:hypothetical protein
VVLLVGRAGEIAAGRLVALLARVPKAAKHAIERQPQLHHGLRRQHEGALDHLGHHFGRAGFLQPRDVRVVEGAHHDRQLRTELAHVLEDRERLGRIRESDYHSGRARDGGSHEHLAP